MRIITGVIYSIYGFTRSAAPDRGGSHGSEFTRACAANEARVVQLATSSLEVATSHMAVATVDGAVGFEVT